MRSGDDGVVFGHVNVDFGAYAELAFEVNAGLDRKGCAGDQCARVPRFEVVDIGAVSEALFADGVAGAVEELVGVTGLPDHPSGNIVDFGWGGWTLDFDNTYYSMMYTGETYNPSYSNPEADALLDEQRGTLDQDKRLDIAHQLNAIFFEDALDVALYQNIYLWGVNDRVKNFSIPPDERLFWLDAWIEG